MTACNFSLSLIDEHEHVFSLENTEIMSKEKGNVIFNQGEGQNGETQKHQDKTNISCASDITENFRKHSLGMQKLIQKETEVYLIECIKHHQSLLDFTEKLDDLWKTVFFFQFLTASILICFLGFQAMTMEIDINFLKMLSYLTAIIFQLGLYCFFGSNLMVQSEAVYKAVYESDWYNQSERYKQLTRMMIMRAQKPVRITAGRFGTLSLPLFASMLRSSYSYFALLRQMHEG